MNWTEIAGPPDAIGKNYVFEDWRISPVKVCSDVLWQVSYRGQVVDRRYGSSDGRLRLKTAALAQRWVARQVAAKLARA